MIKTWNISGTSVSIKEDTKFEHRIIRHNHLLWREMFLECCDNDNSSVVIARLSDPRQCECGRLLYGSLFFRLYINVSGVSELEEEHTRLHAMAKDILEKENNDVTRDTVIASSDRFLELLDNIYKRISKKAIRMRTYHPTKLPRMEPHP